MFYSFVDICALHTLRLWFCYVLFFKNGIVLESMINDFLIHYSILRYIYIYTYIYIERERYVYTCMLARLYIYILIASKRYVLLVSVHLRITYFAPMFLLCFVY